MCLSLCLLKLISIKVADVFKCLCVCICVFFFLYPYVLVCKWKIYICQLCNYVGSGHVFCMFEGNSMKVCIYVCACVCVCVCKEAYQ